MIRYSVTKDMFTRAARLLMLTPEDDSERIFLEFEEEISYVMDFALNDVRTANETAVKSYKRQVGAKTKIEDQILDALISSYTSLFRVTKVHPKDHTVEMYDLLNYLTARITDYHMSKTVHEDMIIFCRILSFGDFKMTSGIIFAFEPMTERHLLREFQRLRKKMNGQPDEIIRFASFFALNRTYGINMVYTNP